MRRFARVLGTAAVCLTVAVGEKPGEEEAQMPALAGRADIVEALAEYEAVAGVWR